jgi:hypothetical protein
MQPSESQRALVGQLVDLAAQCKNHAEELRKAERSPIVDEAVDTILKIAIAAEQMADRLRRAD